MSTIKSSTEHLTLNADGSGKDIKFQANGVEKASISSVGAFTSTSIDATKLSGALPAIDGSALTNLPGGGKVLQVKIVEDSTALTLSTSTYTDVGLSLSITPSSTSSKILAMWNIQGNIAEIATGWGTQLVRGSTNIFTSPHLYIQYGGYARDNSSHMHLDSPNTTSAITYKVQLATYSSRSITFNDGGAQTQLMLMEIAG